MKQIWKITLVLVVLLLVTVVGYMVYTGNVNQTPTRPIKNQTPGQKVEVYQDESVVYDQEITVQETWTAVNITIPAGKYWVSYTADYPIRFALVNPNTPAFARVGCSSLNGEQWRMCTSPAVTDNGTQFTVGNGEEGTYTILLYKYEDGAGDITARIRITRIAIFG